MLVRLRLQSHLLSMLNPLRDPNHINLGADRAGAIDLYECRRAGLSDQRVHWLVDTGRWQSPFPRVFVTFSGPLPDTTMQFAALLYAGAGSALSHHTAGALWRLEPTTEVVHISVPYLRDVDPQPKLAIHRSRTLTERDVHPSLTPRRTRIERTVVDLLASRRSADAALGLPEMIADLRRLHTVKLDVLRALCAAGRRAGRVQPLYREHLAKHFADTFSRIGLPRPYETL